MAEGQAESSAIIVYVFWLLAPRFKVRLEDLVLLIVGNPDALVGDSQREDPLTFVVVFRSLQTDLDLNGLV
jgi:hypothetical protein